MRIQLLVILGIAVTVGCTHDAKSPDDGSGPAVGHDADGTPPTITLLSPLDGATLASTAALLATASDDVGVSDVTFAIDAVILTTDDSEPYEAAWDTTSVLNGNYTVSASATDSAGNSTAVSAGVVVQNDGGASASSVNIINPVDGSAICGTVSVEAVVSMAGAVVVFALDGTDLATDSTEPFSWDWNTESAANGTHTIRATATGSDGLAAQATIQVDVENNGGACDNLPSVSFTAPDASTYGYGPVEISADASDDVGVLKVQFFIDSGLLDEDSSIPYGTTWASDSFDEGPHAIKAIAYDTASQTSETQITMTVDRTPPEVTITDPNERETVEGVVDVSAEVIENFSLSEVEFFLDGDSIGVATSEPYALAWDTTGSEPGTHTIDVLATDMAGLTGTDSIEVSVDNPPTIRITAPSDGATVSGNVAVSASGTDDGGIASVRLYVDGDLQGTDSTSPYAWTWSSCDIDRGAHTLSVDASDGSHTVSDSISVNTNQNIGVELVAPSGTLDATETLIANVSDDETIDTVIFDLDGTPIATETAPYGSATECGLTCACDEYRSSWDASAVALGTHTLTVTATNAAGATAVDSWTVTVDHDADGDGYTGDGWGGTDCDDSRSSVNPSATERCATSYDDDCDGSANDLDAAGCSIYYSDRDGDGYGDAGDSECYCSASGVYDAENRTDCDDSDPAVALPTIWYRDADLDTYGDASVAVESCSQPPGYVANADDCDDSDSSLAADCSFLGPCRTEWEPLYVGGWSRNYTVTIQGAVGTGVQEMVGIGYATSGAEAFVLYDEVDTTASGWLGEAYIACDQDGGTGLYMSEWGMDLTSGGTSYGSVYAVPDHPRRMLPPDDEIPGAGSWTYSYTADVDFSGLPVAITANGTYTESGFETWMAPDGSSYTAYHLSNAYAEDFGGYYALAGVLDQYYVQGLGLVREVNTLTDGTVYMSREIDSWSGLTPY